MENIVMDDLARQEWEHQLAMRIATLVLAGMAAAGTGALLVSGVDGFVPYLVFFISLITLASAAFVRK
jgi:hypothetical protein